MSDKDKEKDKQKKQRDQAKAPVAAAAPVEGAAAPITDAAKEAAKEAEKEEAPVKGLFDSGKSEHQRGRRKRRDSGPKRGADGEESRWVENLVQVNRTAKVIKGGRRFSFSALLVVGDGMGRVGVGFGRANEVPVAVDKAKKDARKNMLQVNLVGDTIPHEVKTKYRASKVSLFPAPAGTGLIAGPTVRAVVEAAGIRNILTKVHGSPNRINVVKATLQALRMLRTKEQVERLRGVTL